MVLAIQSSRNLYDIGNSHIPSFKQQLNIIWSIYELLTSDFVEIETIFLDCVSIFTKSDLSTS